MHGGGAPAAGAPGSQEPNVYGRTDLTYNSYLKVPELLSLQVPQSSPAHHDEMLFIIIHQSYELWFKLILHELENAMDHMAAGQVLRAYHFIKRSVEIMKVLVQQIHILETLAPAEFLQFRDRLMPASGFQSLQFRELEFVAGLKEPRYLHFFKHRPEMLDRLEMRLKGRDLRQCYYEMLRKLGWAVPSDAYELESQAPSPERERLIRAILPIYQEPAAHLELNLLTESLIDLDTELALWREHHVRVVERVIGFKRGTGGSSGVEYLRSTTGKKCFPLLWEVRTHLEKRA
jgi:tryptophan 2,3-dioxygenase